jgi:hypothetical protein
MGAAGHKGLVMITKSITAAAAAVILSVASGVAFAQTLPQTSPQTVPQAGGYPAAAGSPAAAAPTAPRQVDPAVEKFRAACKADISKLCADEIAAAQSTQPAGSEQPGKGAGRGVIAACMTANEAKLSSECKTAWNERKATMKAKQG